MGNCCDGLADSNRPKTIREEFVPIFGEKADPLLDSCITPLTSPKRKSRRAHLIQEVINATNLKDLEPPTYFDDPLLHCSPTLKLAQNNLDNHNEQQQQQDPFLSHLTRLQQNNILFSNESSPTSSSSSSSSNKSKNMMMNNNPLATTFREYHKLIEVSRDDPLFSVIKTAVNQTRSHSSQRLYVIKSIKRIENTRLWSRYALARHKMEKLIELGLHPPCQPLPKDCPRENDPLGLYNPHNHLNRNLELLGLDENSINNNTNSTTGEVADVKNVRGRSILSFDYFKDNLQLKTNTVNEVLLFHGTKPHAKDSICENGLDCVKYGYAHGCFGSESYFGDTSSKAEAYCSTETGSNSSYMFLCRVLLGDFYQVPEGQMLRNVFRPPCTHGHCSQIARRMSETVTDKSQNERFRKYPSCKEHRQADSVIGNVPREFMVYENDRVYPEYLVEFWRGNPEFLL